MGNHQSSLLQLDYAEIRVEEIKEVLQARPSTAISCRQRETGNSLLHLAAAAGNDHVVDELLGTLYSCLRSKPAREARRAEHKAVNQLNNWGQTPLMLACKAGCVRAVRLLLGAGADPTRMDGVSQSNCLHYAARNGRAGVIQALLEASSWAPGGTGGHRLLGETLVLDSQGFHKFVDSLASLGISALHLAVSRGHREAAAALIKAGASLMLRCNPFAVDTQGFPGCSTPLHLAAAQGDQRMALLLLTAWAQQATSRRTIVGPDPRAVRDCLGRRPVDVAQSGGHSPMLGLLDPTTPLPQVAQPPAGSSIPRLASLAAAALLRRLNAQLDELAAQQARHAGEKPAAGLRTSGAEMEGACCPICLEDGCASAAGTASVVACGAQKQQHWQLVAAGGCSHTLCISCARQLCCRAAAGGDGTVKCPLCRQLVGCWRAAAAEA